MTNAPGIEDALRRWPEAAPFADLVVSETAEETEEVVRQLAESMKAAVAAEAPTPPPVDPVRDVVARRDTKHYIAAKLAQRAQREAGK